MIDNGPAGIVSGPVNVQSNAPRVTAAITSQEGEIILSKGLTSKEGFPCFGTDGRRNPLEAKPIHEQRTHHWSDELPITRELVVWQASRRLASEHGITSVRVVRVDTSVYSKQLVLVRIISRASVYSVPVLGYYSRCNQSLEW